MIRRVIDLEPYLARYERADREADLTHPRTHYTLHPNRMYVIPDVRSVLTEACRELDNNEVPVFRPCLVASLRDCFSGDYYETRRARVCFDVDCLPGDFQEAYADDVYRILCEWLSEFTDNAAIETENCTVFEGRFADKRQSFHVYFSELYWGRGNVYREQNVAFESLNERLKVFGLEADTSISNSGLKYPFMDKWLSKEGRWRNDVQLPHVNDLDLSRSLDAGFWAAHDPIYLPAAGDLGLEINFLPKARAKRTRADAPAAMTTQTVIVSADNLTDRLWEAVPEWRGCSFKRISRPEGCSVWVPRSVYCPFKVVPTDLPAHEHKTSKCYAWCDSTGTACIRCWICRDRELTLRGPLLDEDPDLNAVVQRFNARFAVLDGNRVLQYPIETENGIYGLKVFTHQEFVAQERRHNETLKIEGKSQPFPQVWLRHAKATRYPLGIGFDPSQSLDPRIYNSYGGIDPRINKLAQTIEEPDPTRFALWREVVFSNICGRRQDSFEYLMNWMAHVVQRPETKTGVMICLQGDPGCGKGLTAQMLYTIWQSPHGVRVEDSNVMSDFNSHFAHAIIVFLDEGSRPTDARNQNRVKSLVTEKNVMYRQLYRDATPGTSYCNLILASNTVGVHMQNGERRFALYDCHHFVPNEPDFWDRVAAQVDDLEVRAHFYVWLQQRPLNGFVLRRYPMTEATRTAVEESMDAYTSYIYRLLKTGDMWETKESWPSAEHLGHWTSFVDTKWAPYLPHGTPLSPTMLGNDIFQHKGLPQPMELLIKGLNALHPRASISKLTKTLKEVFGKDIFITERIRMGHDFRAKVVRFEGTLPELRTRFLQHVGNLDDSVWDD